MANPYTPRAAEPPVQHHAFCEVYRRTQHRDDVTPYWVTGKRAAELLGVNVSRLNQLAARDGAPYVVHADGTRLYRADQLRVVGNARAARWPTAMRIGC